MTLRDIAYLTTGATTIQIVPNCDTTKIKSTPAVLIWTATEDHNPDIYQYVNDDVMLITPATLEPNILQVAVKHKEN